MIHLLTLGAGGGSIASYDRIHQSPSSWARSRPARTPAPPATTAAACSPTVTDADLLLGYLDPDNYANGRIKLNPKRARFAIEEEIWRSTSTWT